MGPSPVTCEIVEVREGMDSEQHHNVVNPLSSGPLLDNRTEKSSKQKMVQKYTLEDDINKLFEAIDLRASARGPRLLHQFGTDSLKTSASKKPIRGCVSQASGIGISQSVTLKQALRGLCISHASEIAAMKRLSKSTLGSSKISEAGAIKRLYSTVVVEASETGLPSHDGRASLMEISLVPEEGKLGASEKVSLQAVWEKSVSSSVHPPPQIAAATKTEITMTPEEEVIAPVATEVGRHTSILKLAEEGKLNAVHSSSRLNAISRTIQPNNDDSASTGTENKKAIVKFGKNLKLNFSASLPDSGVKNKVKNSAGKGPGAGKPFPKNKCFLNKRAKEPVSACTNSNTGITDINSGNGPSTSKLVAETHKGNRNVKEESPPALRSGCLNVKVSFSNADSRANKSAFISDSHHKRHFGVKTSEHSKSREPVDFSQSSKSSVGEYSSSTCISEESHFCGSSSSCTGSRPHMSKDVRWDAIRHVEIQQGSIGLKHFKLLKRLGCGDVGTVYLAELTGTHCLFAVKIMDTDSLASRKKMSRAQTERDILQMLDHPFLPTLFASFTTNKFSILVMEHCPGGDLHILGQKQPGHIFSEQASRFYVAEVLLALEYLHMLGIVYRDLKPENVLVREDGHIMLCDFDLSLRSSVEPTLVRTSSITAPAKKRSRPCLESSCINPWCPQQPSWVQVPCLTPRPLSRSTKAQALKQNLVAQAPQLLAEPTSARSNSFVGTHEYLAPEILRGEGHGNAVDWWTLGIFLYELLFGITPFKGLGNDDTLANVVMNSIVFPESPSVSTRAKDLIKGLLVKDPQSRFGSISGAAEIRQHPFFEGLNWALIRCATPPMLPKSSDREVMVLASEDSNLPEYKSTAEMRPEFELF